MESFLVLGFLIGMSHALEADHLAAVGTLASSGKATPGRLVFLGASWGMGHTAMLFLISLPVILLGLAISPALAAAMEFAIGLVLIGLGGNVLWKMRARKIHFHVHDHDGGQKHFHAHSHAGAKTTHAHDPHAHSHAPRLSPGAFLVGLAHGAAGSAGLVALAVAATHSIVMSLAYIAVFGIGSILGMAVLTYSANWPLRMADASANRLFAFVQAAVAGVAIFIGASVLNETAPVLWGAV